MTEEVDFGEEYIERYTQTVIRDRETLNPIHIRYYDSEGKLSRLDGPAHIDYDKNGQILEEIYFNGGLKHRCFEEGPAHIKYHPSTGRITFKEFIKFNEPRASRKEGATFVYDPYTGEEIRRLHYSRTGKLILDTARKRRYPQPKISNDFLP